MNECADSIDTWPTHLSWCLANTMHLSRHHIVAETRSTQDTARQINAQQGTVVVAGQQTAGRGRYGRQWCSGSADAGQGVAMSLVLAWTNPQHLAIGCACGVALGLRRMCEQRGDGSIDVGIKWPNDVLIRRVSDAAPTSTGRTLRDCGWRKIAGVLVEQFDERAIVGIGINVAQADWPADLQDRALSLRQVGVAASRIDVMEAVLPPITETFALDAVELERVFASLDVLSGRWTALRRGETTYAGTVRRIDPLRGLELCVDASESIWCPAESTTLADC